MRIEELIGNTPLVEYRGLNLKPGVRILGKLEGQNPGGSVKDRAALGMIKSAMDRGDIKQGDQLVEATSGNTGRALSKKICLLMSLHNQTKFVGKRSISELLRPLSDFVHV